MQITRIKVKRKNSKKIYIDRALPKDKTKGKGWWTLNRCTYVSLLFSFVPWLSPPARPKFRFMPSSRPLRSKLAGFAGKKTTGLFPDDALQRIRRKSLNETATWNYRKAVPGYRLWSNHTSLVSIEYEYRLFFDPSLKPLTMKANFIPFS